MGRTAALALLILAVGAGAAELAVRTEACRRLLPPPSLATGHVMFEAQLDRLDSLVAREGRVDCVFFGSSTVFRGVDPEEVALAYRERTGRSLVCFNFGLGGLSEPEHVAAIGVLLSERVRPELLVWGSHVVQIDMPPQWRWDDFLATPWFRHGRGEWNALGLLLDHSRAAGHLASGIESWSSRRAARRMSRAREASPLGFYPSFDVYEEGTRRPGETAWYPGIRAYDVSSEALAALDRLADLSEPTRMMILEMPIHPHLASLLPGGEADYLRSLDLLALQARHRGLALWPSPPDLVIPDDGWMDVTHLNARGAAVFSRWVGHSLAEAASQGGLPELGR